MEKLLFILLGIGIWQLIVSLMIFITDNEEKVFTVGMGIVGWTIYGIVFAFVKITKCYSNESQAKRIVKSAQRELKKKNKKWGKWYKKYGKYSNNAWNIVRRENGNLIDEMQQAGFDYSRSK